MVISLRAWLKMTRYMILFAALVYFFYHLLTGVARFTSPVDHYRIPTGYSVKAFQSDAEQPSQMGSMAERLLFYYWYGE